MHDNLMRVRSKSLNWLPPSHSRAETKRFLPLISSLDNSLWSKWNTMKIFISISVSLSVSPISNFRNHSNDSRFIEASKPPIIANFEGLGGPSLCGLNGVRWTTGTPDDSIFKIIHAMFINTKVFRFYEAFMGKVWCWLTKMKFFRW